MGTLVGGTAGAQLIGIAAAPILTRLYSPEDFGVLAVFAGLLAIVLVVSSLRYELAIPLPESEQTAANILVLCLALVICTTVAITLLVLFFGGLFAHLAGVPALSQYLWLLPLGVLFGGAYTVFTYWSLRTKRFRAIAATKVRQAVAMLGIQIGAYKMGTFPLLLGQVVGHGAGATSLALPAFRVREIRRVTAAGVMGAARRYKRFPAFTIWSGFLNSGGTQLPVILIAAWFSSAPAGLYALAHRVLNLPSALVGTAIQNVFFSGAAEAHRKDQLQARVRKLLKLLVHTAAPPILILAVAGKEIFTLFFGAEWAEAGVLAQWMSPWILMQFCTGPLTVINSALEKQNIGLLMQAQLFLVRMASLLAGSLSGDLVRTIQMFSLGSAVGYFIFLIVMLRLVGLSVAAFLQPLFWSLVLSAGVAAPLLLHPAPFADVLTTAFLFAAVGVLGLARYYYLFRFSI